MAAALTLLANAGFAEVVQVPATANLWLAGMSNGTTARRDDCAPDESPVAPTDTLIEAGGVYVFSASGSANHGSPLPFFPPEGETAVISHYLGEENGIADLTAPFSSLVGVFLGANQPDQSPPPHWLDFRTQAARDYLLLAPALRQPFFIGGGMTSSGAVRQVIAPAGATRLLLGVMDEYHWADNQGSFTVEIRKMGSARLDRLRLHPSPSPEDADAMASPGNPVSRAPISAFDASPGVSGPELHAFTAIELVWPSETNRFYQVQWTPSLDSPQWINLGSAAAGSGTDLSVFDSTRAHPQGFYRVQILPSAPAPLPGESR